MTAELHSALDMKLAGVEGRVAVVTGSASGIGRCVEATLRGLGARVAGIDVDHGAERDLSCIADVRDRLAVDTAFREIEAALGPVEILVTSAGVFQPTPLLRLDDETWHRTLDINLTGTFNCLQRAAASMRERRWGRIVTIASGAGLDGGTEACADYAASKGGVIALTKAASKELAKDGVTVNCVAPRAVATQMVADLEDELAAQVPVGRVGSVDDVAAGVAFLCSAHASYVTGEVLVMNGGWW